MWREIALWAGIVLFTWLESKPRLVDSIESGLAWIDRRSGWWILVAYVLWGIVGQRFLTAFFDAINPHWLVAILAGLLWAIGTLAIVGWGLMKLITWVLRPRNKSSHTNPREIRNSAPPSAQKNESNRGHLYESVKERRSRYLSMHRERTYRAKS